MLEHVDLSLEIDKKRYRALLDPLELRLGELQRKAREAEMPVVIVFEGWDASGKGTLINSLMMALDPRGFKVYSTNQPSDEERFRPWLWRFWTRIPARGQIAIFDRSWYGRVLVERIDKIVKKREWRSAYGEINAFERMLADDRSVMVKFFLHITKKEQKKRFAKLAANPATRWKVTKDDMRRHRQYEKYLPAVEEMLARTATSWAPWTVIEAHDRRYATVKMLTAVAKAIERGLAPRRTGAAVTLGPRAKGIPRRSALDAANLSLTLERPEYERTLDRLQQRIRELEHEAYRHRIPVVIVYEGWDAAGKGGNIRRLVQAMDPRGYEVVPIGPPTDEEKRRHYLWRFWKAVPKAGHITIFDRSWYGRVLVERVEGFCAEAEWSRAYHEINEMEEQWARFGVVMVKFWLHISKDEQLRRFKSREKTPHKRWKITGEDWRNREKWDLYKEAVDEMIERTSTPQSPWTVVESNCKLFARIKTLTTVVERLEQALDA